MSLIIFSKNNNKEEYGVINIDNQLFKKLTYNEIIEANRFIDAIRK